MRLLDLLGRRWTLRIVWELREEGATFRVLRERCGDVSPSVLNTRLGELREAGIVEIADADGYVLSARGRALLPALGALDGWARQHLG
ncbi:MAG: helix-turn-helix domain-containing protein [Sandaracinus sp.]